MTLKYCTLENLRSQIDKTGTTGAGSDAALTLLIEAVQNAIDNFCNRPDGFVAVSTAAARYYTGNDKPYIYIDEFVEITKLEVKDSASDTTYVTWDAPTSNMAGDGDYFAFSGDPLSPNLNPIVQGKPYDALMVDPNGDGGYTVFTSGRWATRGGFRPSSGYPRGLPTVKATAKWGYASTVPSAIKEATIALSSRWFKQGESAWADTLASPELGQLIYRKENVDIRFMLESGRYVRPATGRR
jgi:hypothetical protein